jgi:hypothetical protein
VGKPNALHSFILVFAKRLLIEFLRALGAIPCVMSLRMAVRGAPSSVLTRFRGFPCDEEVAADGRVSA